MYPDNLYLAILNLYTRCNVKAFPIDCFDIAHRCGFKTVKYSELKGIKKSACVQLSPDSCLIGDTIYYENKNSPRRIRFSIMHELGHVFLETSSEEKADIFSSHSLAPRPIMWHLECTTVKDVYNTFNVSCMAANKIVEDYKVFPFWENRELQKRIRDWFFPHTVDLASSQLGKEQSNDDDRSEFFDTLRAHCDEQRMIERAMDQWLYGNHY